MSTNSNNQTIQPMSNNQTIETMSNNQTIETMKTNKEVIKNQITKILDKINEHILRLSPKEYGNNMISFNSFVEMVDELIYLANARYNYHGDGYADSYDTEYENMFQDIAGFCNEISNTYEEAQQTISEDMYIKYDSARDIMNKITSKVFMLSMQMKVYANEATAEETKTEEDTINYKDKYQDVLLKIDDIVDFIDGIETEAENIESSMQNMEPDMDSVNLSLNGNEIIVDGIDIDGLDYCLNNMNELLNELKKLKLMVKELAGKEEVK